MVPRQENVLYIFVASPSDVAEERNRLEEVITELNQTWSRSFGIRLDLIRWETYAYPAFGDDAQDVINRQVPADYDVFLGVMWHRFGTTTSRAESGTQEEFLRAKARWDNDKSSVCLMVYFKDAPISPSQLDPSQLGRVTEFRESLDKEGGLYWSFQSTDDFVNLVRIHLTRVVQDWERKLPLPHTREPSAQRHDAPSVDAQAIPLDDGEVGLLELSEQVEDSFAEATDVITRIGKTTQAFGKKMQENNRRMEAATTAGRVTRASAKRLIAKVAKDMNDYAGKLDRDVPTLSDLMKTGIGGLSQAISMWPEFIQDEAQRDQVAESITAMRALRSTLSTAETQIRESCQAVTSIPRVTGDLNRAKRSVRTALQNLIDLLQTQQQLLAQAERSAADLVNPQDDV